jgi:hypothetical protein
MPLGELVATVYMRCPGETDEVVLEIREENLMYTHYAFSRVHVKSPCGMVHGAPIYRPTNNGKDSFYYNDTNLPIRKIVERACYHFGLTPAISYRVVKPDEI